MRKNANAAHLAGLEFVWKHLDGIEAEQLVTLQEWIRQARADENILFKRMHNSNNQTNSQNKFYADQ